MINFKKFRKKPEKFIEILKHKNVDNKLLEELIICDQEINKLINKEKELNTTKNKIAKTINSLYACDKQDHSINSDVQQLQKKIKELKLEHFEISKELKQKQTEFDSIFNHIPNIFDESVPIGNSSENNKVIRTKIFPHSFDFVLKTHDQLAKDNNLVNFNKGPLLTGSRFVVYSNNGALILQALINFTLDIQIKNGYIPHILPVIVKKESLFTTGQLPKFQDDLFQINNQFFLSPTSEVQLINLYREQILKLEQLPIKLCANTACFRQEAGASCRDTKGFIRLHQFFKTELVVICHPSKSYQMLMQMLEHVESILEKLKLTYRWVELCSGDLGFSAAKTYDLEVWIPAEKRWLELSSCSNTTDFQSRRGMIRFKEDISSKADYVHILNGSGVAIDRLLVAIIENYQTTLGKITIPDALLPYLHNITEI